RVKEKALKSHVNLNNVGEFSQMGKGRTHDNFNNGGRENFRGKG
ncbi:hypothetical protein A2U01_0106958, partial [Trifolium medium]|nr:hypothetical protein [Trifolium medium]